MTLFWRFLDRGLHAALGLDDGVVEGHRAGTPAATRTSHLSLKRTGTVTTHGPSCGVGLANPLALRFRRWAVEQGAAKRSKEVGGQAPGTPIL